MWIKKTVDHDQPASHEARLSGPTLTKQTTLSIMKQDIRNTTFILKRGTKLCYFL